MFIPRGVANIKLDQAELKLVDKDAADEVEKATAMVDEQKLCFDDLDSGFTMYQKSHVSLSDMVREKAGVFLFNPVNVYLKCID